MTIERATPLDVESLLEFDVWLTTPARHAAIVRESVASGGCLVARDSATPRGYVTWDCGFFGRPFVRLLVVAGGMRRRGLGRALLAAVERAAAAHGELFVSTEALNAPMRALLGSLAYTASGSIDNINAPGNPELVFHKPLAGPATLRAG